MKTIPLTKGYQVRVSDEDYQKLISMGSWYADVRNERVYARKADPISGKKLWMHRVILGIDKPGVDVDHIDRDGLNNMRSNLRVVTRAENNMNAKKRKNANSKYKGVALDKRRMDKDPWFARIYIDGKATFLGNYKTEEEAALAYNEAAKKHFGNHARLNEIDEEKK